MKKILSFLLIFIFLFCLCSCDKDSIGAISHTHKFEESHTNGNCSTYGYTTYHCICGDTYVETDTEYGDHIYSLEYTIDVQPTLESDGEKSRHCLYCNARIDITSIEKEKVDLPLINP